MSVLANWTKAREALHENIDHLRAQVTNIEATMGSAIAHYVRGRNQEALNAANEAADLEFELFGHCDSVALLIDALEAEAAGVELVEQNIDDPIPYAITEAGMVALAQYKGDELGAALADAAVRQDDSEGAHVA
jgi:hypothetical protein